MATTTITRKDSGKLLSDKCTAWSGWNLPWNMAEIPTIEGVPYLQKTGVMTVRCQATFRFRSDYANSTIDNYFELMEYAKELGVLLFQDLEGWTTEVQIYQPPGGEGGSFAVSGPKLQTVYEVPLDLLKRGYIP